LLSLFWAWSSVGNLACSRPSGTPLMQAGNCFGSNQTYFCALSVAGGHRAPMQHVLPLCLSFCGFVVLTNLSLQYNSVGFYQVPFLWCLHHEPVAVIHQAASLACLFRASVAADRGLPCTPDRLPRLAQHQQWWSWKHSTSAKCSRKRPSSLLSPSAWASC
jgi:hypothetical protein